MYLNSRASPNQRLFQLVSFYVLERYSGKRVSFYFGCSVRNEQILHQDQAKCFQRIFRTLILLIVEEETLGL